MSTADPMSGAFDASETADRLVFDRDGRWGRIESSDTSGIVGCRCAGGMGSSLRVGGRELYGGSDVWVVCRESIGISGSRSSLELVRSGRVGCRLIPSRLSSVEPDG